MKFYSVLTGSFGVRYNTLSAAAWAAKVQSTFQSIEASLEADAANRKPWITLINKIGESRVTEAK